jgi:hypothetical protein
MMVISFKSHTQHVHEFMDILGEDIVNVKFLSSWKMFCHVSLQFFSLMSMQCVSFVSVYFV